VTISSAQVVTLANALPVASGGTGATTNAGAAFALKGANSDITSLSGLTTPLSAAQGGTGATSNAAAPFALKGANSDITSLSGLTTPLSVGQGGTGVTSSTGSGSVVLGTSPTISSPTINGTPVMGASILTRGTAVTLSSQTSVDFTSIPSWVKRITVMITGVKQNTGGANPFTFRIGTSGGIVSTGYSGSAGYFGGTPGSTSITAGFEFYFDTAANFYTGSMTITNITGNTWLGVGWFSSTQGYQYVTSAYLALGATLDRVRFTTNNGTNTFTTGTVNILYE
jgi:hypothetical protein